MTNSTPDLESIRKRATTNDIDEAADTDDLIRACDVAMMDRNVLLAEVDRLTAALATAKDEERAAVVVLLKAEADRIGVLSLVAAGALLRCADVVEAGEHREKA